MPTGRLCKLVSRQHMQQQLKYNKQLQQQQQYGLLMWNRRLEMVTCLPIAHW